MNPSVSEHAARFDKKAPSYDGNKNEEYRATLSLVIAHAAPDSDDTVLDLGTGTGAVAIAVADAAETVLGRDPSDGMLEQARAKPGGEKVAFETGRFRAPAVTKPVDIVVSNFALHHLDDPGKREAIETIAALEPRRFVLGDLMFFATPDPDEPYYDPSVDDPATVGVLADAFTDAGFAVTAVERVHQQLGVVVGER